MYTLHKIKLVLLWLSLIALGISGCAISNEGKIDLRRTNKTSETIIKRDKGKDTIEQRFVQLTREAFKTLADEKKIPAEILEKLEPIIDQVFTVDKFLTEVEVQIGKKESLLRIGEKIITLHKKLILESAQKSQTFLITDQSINKLNQKNISNEIIEPLENLKGKVFEDLSFVDQISKKIGEKKIEIYIEQLLEISNKDGKYQLPAEIPDGLKNDDNFLEIFNKLDSIKDQEYTKKSDFETDLEKIIKTNEVILKLGEKILEKDKELIIENSKQELKFQLTSQALQKMKEGDVPSDILTQLDPVKYQGMKVIMDPIFQTTI